MMRLYSHIFYFLIPLLKLKANLCNFSWESFCFLNFLLLNNASYMSCWRYLLGKMMSHDKNKTVEETGDVMFRLKKEHNIFEIWKNCSRKIISLKLPLKDCLHRNKSHKVRFMENIKII